MFGYIQDTPDARDFSVSEHLNQNVGLPSNVPDDVDYRGHFFAVQHQQQTGSCVGFAAAQVLYANLSVRNVVLPEIPSPLWLYRKARVLAGTQNEDKGSQPRLLMKGVQDFGFCLERYWPFAEEEILKGEPALARQHAYDQRAQVTYYRASDYDPGQRKYDIKRAIASRKPLMLALTLDQGFMGGPSVWSFSGGPSVGRHMVACFAYTPEGIIITNSWGPLWGNRGCTLVTWGTVLDTQHCTDVIIIDAEPTPSEVTSALLPSCSVPSSDGMPTPAAAPA